MSPSELVRWWMMFVIIWNRSGQWYSICTDAEIIWINITYIFYKWRLDCLRIVTHRYRHCCGWFKWVSWVGAFILGHFCTWKWEYGKKQKKKKRHKMKTGGNKYDGVVVVVVVVLLLMDGLDFDWHRTAPRVHI